MKKSIFTLMIIIIVFILSALSCLAQDKYNVKILNDHDVQLTSKTDTIILSLENATNLADEYIIFVKKSTKKNYSTGKFYIKDGIQYPIYRSVNNKLYYIKTSKAGNQYKVYIERS